MASKRKTTPGIPIHIEEALKRAWPDGLVDMPINYEESYFWDNPRQFRTGLSRIKGAFLAAEHPAENDPAWDDEPDPTEDPPVGDEGSRSYHLFFIMSGDERTKYETEIDQLDEGV